MLWMLPWIGLALAALYAGYVAYSAKQERDRRAFIPVGPDPRLELEQINAEIERLAADSRRHLDAARDAMRQGLR